MPSVTWLAAAGVSVREWHCPGAQSALGPEESPRAFEVSVVRQGAYQRQLADRTVNADPGVAVCGNPAEPFRMAHVPGRAARETVIALDERCFRELLATVDARAADRGEVRFPADAVPLGGRAALAHAAVLRARRSGADPLVLHERALELAACTVLGATRRPRPQANLTPRARDAVLHTRALLDARFAEPLTLDALARTVDMTPWHLSRIFRAAMGESIHQRLVRIRLNAALERIALQERNLTRIALECGFSSHSHFTSAFRRAFGRAPSVAL